MIALLFYTYNMTELVFKSNDGIIVTTSLKVAETFGKDHGRVLRDIRELSCSTGFRQGNFAESSLTGIFFYNTITTCYKTQYSSLAF